MDFRNDVTTATAKAISFEKHDHGMASQRTTSEIQDSDETRTSRLQGPVAFVQIQGLVRMPSIEANLAK
jgi:hypothetical protein